MRTATNIKTLAQDRTLHAAMPAIAMVTANSKRRCERALVMLLTQRGDAFTEVSGCLPKTPGACPATVCAPH